MALETPTYPPHLEDLLTRDDLPDLGPGSPDETKLAAIRALAPTDLFPDQMITDEEMARACLCGLFLLHDGLDESHQISQRIDSGVGSVWHGIMHRREPDADNAKYWFGRAGAHPVGNELAAAAGRRVSELPHASPLAIVPWDAARFVDFCEEHRGTGSPQERVAKQIQQDEWDLLFAYCYRAATS